MWPACGLSFPWPVGQGNHRAAVDEIVFTHLPGPLQRVLRILGWDAAPGVILDGCTC